MHSDNLVASALFVSLVLSGTVCAQNRTLLTYGAGTPGSSGKVSQLFANLTPRPGAYVGTHSSGVVNEYDGATLALLRTWNVGNNVTPLGWR